MSTEGSGQRSQTLVALSYPVGAFAMSMKVQTKVERQYWEPDQTGPPASKVLIISN
jgi:hypothetical protein